MYLKNIEVHGFKSFAQKINFEFHNGITGIVGPNGSGKSNVGDAVRWVLGEQSAKQLRGASMQDVIFAGTENRKPLSYAYVAITMDNSDHQLAIDFEEVTVARRVYRSGESEYLINGTQCRLKDVNELFYDTGIGKEGYSIIGQGQIDKILSGKPEERRELFDEAAGIVKFKRRKATALKKLEESCDIMEKSTSRLLKDVPSLISMVLKNLAKLCFWYCIPFLILFGTNEISILDSLSITSLSVMSAAVIPTPAGVGAVELIMTNLFAVLVGVHKAGAITVLYRVATFIFPFVVGGVLILISKLVVTVHSSHVFR